MILLQKGTKKWLFACVLAAFLQPAASQADLLYNLAWRGTMYKTSKGKVVAKPFTEKIFINEVAKNYGIKASDLALAYRPKKRDISMVRRSNGAFVASIIQMEYVYTDVADSKGSTVYRQTFLFDEYHDSAIGTAFGTQKTRLNPSGSISFTYTGRFNYAFPEESEVFTGSFSTGSQIRDKSN